jgi:hypothetical protein
MAACLYAADMLDIFRDKLPGGEQPGRFFNFHVLVHVVMQIRWFGSLLIMSANRWETTHSSVKRLYRATRRHTRTLASCMVRAHSNSQKAAFLAEHAVEAAVKPGAGTVHAQPSNNGSSSGSGSDIDTQSDSDSSGSGSGNGTQSDDDGGVFADRDWTKVSKEYDVKVGDQGAVEKFTFEPAVAAAFWR